MAEATPTTAAKPSGATIIDNAENAAAGRPPVLCRPGCQPCARIGWMFLPVLHGIVPKEHEADLKSAGYACPEHLGPEFHAIRREGTVPVARVLRQGYVVVIFPLRHRADVWQIAPDGLARKVLHQVNAEQYAKHQSAFLTDTEPKACSRGATNVPATLIHVEHAVDVAEVWVGFTPHLWAPSVFEAFLKNGPGARPAPNGKIETGPMRTLHGRTLSPSGILGGTLPAGAMPINVHSLNAIADFVKAPGKRFKEAFMLATQPLDPARAGLGEEFASNVRFMEKANGPTAAPGQYENTSLIVLLDDPIGIMADHNTLRLAAVEAKKLWSIGAEGVHHKVDPARVWALRSSLHVDMALQYEAARDAQRIRTEVDRRLHANLTPVTEEDFEADRAAGNYPPETTWVPSRSSPQAPTLVRDPRADAKRDARTEDMWVASRRRPGQQTRLGKLRLPPDYLAQSSRRAGAEKAQGMAGRLKGRVDMDALESFRREFDAESARWDQRIGELDRDFLAWRDSWRFGAAYLNQVEHKINLVQPDPALGTLDQQMADYAERLGIIDKAIGGGAIGIDSARALAKLYTLPPDDPLNWLNASVYKAFDFKKEVWDDPGNKSEAGESVAGVRALTTTVRQALDKQEKRMNLERSLASILAARSQMVNLVAASVDKKIAESLGLAHVAEEAARKAFRLHIKVNLLVEELVHTRPAARARMQHVFNMRIPLGMAIDEARDAMALGVMPVNFESRGDTSRSQRRHTNQQFRNLDGRITAQTNFPVLLSQDMLSQLQREVIAGGEGLVELLPDAHTGMSSGPIKVPGHLARRLVREQVVSFKKALLGTTEGRVLGAIGAVQGLAFFDTAKKISEEQGIKQADAILSTISTTFAMFETATTVGLHAYTLRADGARTLTVSTAKTMAGLRLGAGLFGMAASALDASLAFLRANDAARTGDAATAKAYRRASGLYMLSTMTTLAGSSFTYSAFKGVGFIAGRIGVSVASLLGAWLMGAGIVMAIGGFAYMLYALYTAYQDLDKFLDRGYWGQNILRLGPFGDVTRKQLDEVLTDRKLEPNAKLKSMGYMVQQGMDAEIQNFNLLPLGIQITFEWHKNWFKGHALAVTVAAGEWPAQRRITIGMELFTAKGAPPVPVLNEAGLLLEGNKNEDSQMHEWTRPWTFGDDMEKQFAHARLTYSIWGENDRDVLTRGQMWVVRDAD